MVYEKPGFCDLLLRFDVSTPSEVDFETFRAVLCRRGSWEISSQVDKL